MTEKCPHCGGGNIWVLLYGYDTGFGEKDNEDLIAKKMVFAARELEDDSPAKVCGDCRTEFGRVER